MKFKLLIYIILSHFIFSQVNLYLEPLSFNSEKKINLINLNNLDDFVINESTEIIQYNINLVKLKSVASQDIAGLRVLFWYSTKYALK